MSYKIMDEVIRTSTQKGVPKMVLVALASFASDDGVCWPAYDTLADRAGVSIASVRRAIKRLVESGDVQLHGQGNGRSSSVYRITRVIRESTQCDQREHPGCSDRSGRVIRESRQGDQREQAGCSERSPNLSVESVNESITESPAEWEKLRIKIGSMFGRKPDSVWSKAEMIALGPVAVSGTSEEDLEMLRRYYRSSNIPGERDFRRGFSD